MFDKLWRRVFGGGDPAAEEGSAKPDPIADAQAAITEEQGLIAGFERAIADSHAGVQGMRHEARGLEEEIVKFGRIKDAAAYRGDAASVEEAARMWLRAEDRLAATNAPIEAAIEKQGQLQAELKAAQGRIETARSRLSILRAEASGVVLRTKIADHDLAAQEETPGATDVVDGADRRLDADRATANATERLVAAGRPPEVDLTDDVAVADEVQQALKAAGH